MSARSAPLRVVVAEPAAAPPTAAECRARGSFARGAKPATVEDLVSAALEDSLRRDDITPASQVLNDASLSLRLPSRLLRRLEVQARGAGVGMGTWAREALAALIEEEEGRLS